MVKLHRPTCCWSSNFFRKQRFISPHLALTPWNAENIKASARWLCPYNWWANIAIHGDHLDGYTNHPPPPPLPRVPSWHLTTLALLALQISKKRKVLRRHLGWHFISLQVKERWSDYYYHLLQLWVKVSNVQICETSVVWWLHLTYLNLKEWRDIDSGGDKLIGFYLGV